ncbi:MAG: GntR family transcriptional regulator [Arachnia propionica]|nr:MAG: GntR family transcriptional regulator [Arachnia propionica]
MEFDTSSPIWLQIMSEFRRRLVAGELAPGERLSGVRDLAAEMGVNPNTVQRAMAELEREGLVYTERAQGRFATTDPEIIARLRHDVATAAADQFIDQTQGAGMTRTQAQTILDSRWNEREAQLRNGKE